MTSPKQTYDTSLLLTARLNAHGFEPYKFTTPLEVVTAFGAMQAQDYGQAVWAIASRIPGSTRDDIEAAITRFEIIRTWSMRGTIHFVPASDTKWMVDLLTPRITAKLKSRRKELNITSENLTHCAKILTQHLRGRKLLSRSHIFQLFEEKGEPTANQRGVHILLELAQQGLVFIGPNDGKRPTFGLLDEFVTSTVLSRDESLRTIATRFFQSHAPATIKDFVYWSGLTVADAKKAIELAGTKLKQITISDDLYIAGASLQLPSTPIKNSIHLMAGFDEYFLPYRMRHIIIDSEHTNHVTPGGNGVFKPTVVINGVVSGVWSRQVKAHSVTLTVHMFPGVTITANELAHPISVYERFIAQPVVSDLKTM